MSSLIQALLTHAQQTPQKPAFCEGDAALSWRGLAERVAALAEVLAADGQPTEVVALTGGNSLSWVVGFLAAQAAGKTLVPIPAFFSAEQAQAVLQDAGAVRVLTSDDSPLPPAVSGLPQVAVGQAVGSFEGDKLGNLDSLAGLGDQPTRLIIYTSGSTGRPKGVRLTSGQVDWTAERLAELAGVGAGDRYLSLLPLSMLLETICAVMIPVLVGGQSVLASTVAREVVRGSAADLASLFEAEQPSMSLMVPQLLGLYTKQLITRGLAPPKSLRFVAVGGAPLAPGLAQAARQVGLPIFEGYGLSECASVVAVNRPGSSADAAPADAVPAGQVGLPLPGLTVTIDQGEIVVEGPNVMDGYLHGAEAGPVWRTGDMGALDDQGRLTIFGRKDNLLVTPTGRNISPEWIEAMLGADPRLAAACLLLVPDDAAGDSTGDVGQNLTMLLIPLPGHRWFLEASAAALLAYVQQACQSAPDYAVPQAAVLLPIDQALSLGVLSPRGGLNRAAAASQLVALLQRPTGTSMQTYDLLLQETAPAHDRFISIPLVQQAVTTGGPLPLYIDFLTQAYHHVKYTFTLLSLAAAHTKDEAYEVALLDYMEEERGHEKWILDDIRALGGDAEAVASGRPGQACHVMVSYAWYAIEHISPYAMLGMVHVLEGLSVLLADKVAGAVQGALGIDAAKGFSYLSTHGALDIEHTEMFKGLVNSFEDEERRQTIIEATKVFYRLYGAIFEDLGEKYGISGHAAA